MAHLARHFDELHGGLIVQVFALQRLRAEQRRARCELRRSVQKIGNQSCLNKCNQTPKKRFRFDLGCVSPSTKILEVLKLSEPTCS